MRILVTGSRWWSDKDIIRWALLDAYRDLDPDNGAGRTKDVVVVHGACPYGGADWIADGIARSFGWTPEPHPADWKMLKKAAGPVRNQAMVDLGADVCLAFFWPDSRGTVDCAQRADRAGILVRPYKPDHFRHRPTEGSV